MKTRKAGICIALIGCLAIGTAGCGTDPLVAAATGAMKIAGGQMSQLTATEVQAISQLVVNLINEETGGSQPPLTAEQAAAIVAFLQANNINTPEDITALIEQAQQDPSSIQGLDELAQAFLGTESEFDPNNVDPETLAEILAGAFGGNPGG